LQTAAHKLLVFVGVLDAIPDAHEVSLLLGEHQLAVGVFHGLEKYLHLMAGRELHIRGKFRTVDHPFGFEPNINDDLVARDGEHLALHDLTLFDRLNRALVQFGETLRFFRIVFAFSLLRGLHGLLCFGFRRSCDEGTALAIALHSTRLPRHAVAQSYQPGTESG